MSDDLRELGLQAICVHSEPMSQDERAHVASRFGCRIATNYYCNEVWAIAAECRFGALHQFPDNVVLEIVDDRGRPVPRGERGHVLVTSLHNFVQPFIRYRLGDIAAWEPDTGPCNCGLDLPRLRALEGRDDDYLEYPDGRRMHPSRITVAVKSPCFEYPGAQIFRDYRITQDGPAHVLVQIVPGRDADALARLRRGGTPEPLAAARRAVPRRAASPDRAAARQRRQTQDRRADVFERRHPHMNGVPGHKSPVSCAAVRSDGRVYASGGYDRSVLLWDASSGEVLRELRGHTGLVNAVDWSPATGACSRRLRATTRRGSGIRTRARRSRRSPATATT